MLPMIIEQSSHIHQEEIDADIRLSEKLIEENATPLSALIEKAQQRLKEKNG